MMSLGRKGRSRRLPHAAAVVCPPSSSCLLLCFPVLRTSRLRRVSQSERSTKKERTSRILAPDSSPSLLLSLSRSLVFYCYRLPVPFILSFSSLVAAAKNEFSSQCVDV